MKVLWLSLIILLFSACGNDQWIQGHYCETYGIVTETEYKTGECKNYPHRAILGNVVWSVILVEMVIPTVYFIGWSLYEPIPESEWRN